VTKRKIGFWFENKTLGNIDISTPERGNPGIGGTEYQFVLIAYALLTFCPGEYEVYFFVEKEQKIPRGINQIQVSDLCMAYDVCTQNNIQFLVFRPRRDISQNIKSLKFAETKLIPWLHITPKREYLDWFVGNTLIHSVIFVGDDQRMRTIDHKVYKESRTIYNSASGQFEATQSRRKDTVVFLGALVPRKGFHILAKAWTEVHRRHPEAKLNVIGSGRLYDKNVKLGPLGIADAKYESVFMRILGGKEGIREKSVHFLGNLGVEKKSYISEATVGVVNPSGITENCPMSVVEFYEHGIPVVSSKKYGLRDMIIPNKTGLLCNSSRGLSKAIINLLDDQTNAQKMGTYGLTFAQGKFSPLVVVKDWVKVFEGGNAGNQRQKGYFVHKIFAFFKSIHVLPESFPMVEDLKIYLARIRNSLFNVLR
jgi:glycosyltransferase involved in cell wall biosynthesis